MEELVEKATIEDVFYLLVYGETPSPDQKETFTKNLQNNYSYDNKLD